MARFRPLVAPALQGIDYPDRRAFPRNRSDAKLPHASCQTISDVGKPKPKMSAGAGRKKQFDCLALHFPGHAHAIVGNINHKRPAKQPAAAQTSVDRDLNLPVGSFSFDRITEKLFNDQMKLGRWHKRLPGLGLQHQTYLFWIKGYGRFNDFFQRSARAIVESAIAQKAIADRYQFIGSGKRRLDHIGVSGSTLGQIAKEQPQRRYPAGGEVSEER